MNASNACRSPTAYCSIGTPTPITASQGYYSVVDANGNFVSQALCPIGYYCVNGTARPCPAGSYGDVGGLFTSACAGVCIEGYYCSQGSTSPTAAPCATDPSFYCSAVRVGRCHCGVMVLLLETYWEVGRKYTNCTGWAGRAGGITIRELVLRVQGTTLPQAALSGYYTVSSVSNGSDTTHQSAQVQCPAGSYCAYGVLTPCPGGQYGAVPGTCHCRGPAQQWTTCSSCG